MLWYDNIYWHRMDQKAAQIKSIACQIKHTFTSVWQSVCRCIVWYRDFVKLSGRKTRVQKMVQKKIVSKKNKFAQQTIAENEWKKRFFKKPNKKIHHQIEQTTTEKNERPIQNTLSIHLIADYFRTLCYLPTIDIEPLTPWFGCYVRRFHSFSPFKYLRIVISDQYRMWPGVVSVKRN